MDNPLCHQLSTHFDVLRACDSLAALSRDPVYRRIEPDVNRVLDAVVQYRNGDTTRRPKRAFYRAVAWNIERGLQLDGVIEMLAAHPQLRHADAYFLTELDFGMARTANRDVAAEIAKALGVNGVLVPCYLNLDKGSGIERKVADTNLYGIHGNAFFSPWPIRDAASLALPNGKDKMRGKEKRIGCQRAVVATVELPAGPLVCSAMHLDAHSSQAHRRRQLEAIVRAVKAKSDGPVLLGGDWNTSTHNTRRALWSIIGFWIRVMMSVRYCLRRHYPYPDRLFERGLFRMLERHGFDYRSLNEPGGCTLHHDILAEADRSNLRDWVPAWCLDFIEWALRPFGGKASLKLDWFAGRGLKAAGPTSQKETAEPDGESAAAPRVIHALRHNGRRLSDHDPIVLDFQI